MKSLIVCVSVSHGNTKQVADVLADELSTTVVTPEQVVLAEMADHDLIAFGSGIYYSRMHRRLRHLVRGLPDGRGTRAVVFATSGHRELLGRFTRSLERQLARHNYDVVGSFVCRGRDTWLPLRLLGGVSLGHPDENDLQNARAFARSVSDSLSTDPRRPTDGGTDGARSGDRQQRQVGQGGR